MQTSVWPILLLLIYIYIHLYIYTFLFLLYTYIFIYFLYHTSLLTGLLDYILCPYRAVVGKFLWVGQHWYVSVKESKGQRHLWVRPCFSGSVLVSFIWTVLEMGSRWPYSYCFVGSYFQALFKIARSILVQFLSSFFSIRLISVHLVYPHGRIDMTAALKKLRFILSDRFGFHMIDNLSMAVYAFSSRILMSFSVDEMLLRRYVNLSTSFREPIFRVMSPFWLKHMYYFFSDFIWRPMPPAG